MRYGKTVFQCVRTVVLVTGLALVQPPENARAGAMDPGPESAPVTQIRVGLHGVCNFATTQLFDYLLGQLPGVAGSRQTRVQLLPGDPGACRADWSVGLIGEGADQLQKEMMAEIRGLDQERQNDSLYEAPFLVTREALAEIKGIIPARLGSAEVDFTLEVLAGETVPGDRDLAGCPRMVWYKRPGMGFD